MKVLYQLQGIVMRGKGRGNKLGFPTINTVISQEIPEGIYISQIKIADKLHNCLTFVGTARTFNESVYQAETYVLDYEKKVYNKLVHIYLYKKIRDNKKFDSSDKLIKQMKNDEEEARLYFRQHNQ